MIKKNKKLTFVSKIYSNQYNAELDKYNCTYNNIIYLRDADISRTEVYKYKTNQLWTRLTEIQRDIKGESEYMWNTENSINDCCYVKLTLITMEYLAMLFVVTQSKQCCCCWSVSDHHRGDAAAPTIDCQNIIFPSVWKIMIY